jgi:hypothetical protein
MRRIGNRLRFAGSDQLVAGADFLDGAGQNDSGRIARSRQLRRAKVDGFIGECLIRIGVD